MEAIELQMMIARDKMKATLIKKKVFDSLSFSQYASAGAPPSFLTRSLQISKNPKNLVY